MSFPAQLLSEIIKGEVRFNEPMHKHTSWHIGGTADIFVLPGDIVDLREALSLARRCELPVSIIGNGTNLLVSDLGVRGMVIKIGPGLSRIEVRGERIQVGAGVPLPRLAAVAMRSSLSGFEFLAGIPGTVGGALVMNAGANGCAVGERVRQVTAVDFEGKEVQLNNQELEFSYRCSCLIRRKLIVAEVEFEGIPGNADAIKAKMDSYLERRRKTQPLEYPNAGSVFKNPTGDSAGKLIEQSGCKGMREGNIQVSPCHANFFVNLGGGTAQQVLALVEKVQQRVFEKFGCKLIMEVQKLGEF
ncbi:UDP-N-acetylmuramate dehydrogenase [Desulfotomaculum arcticum]|uniref:UDP-N-acetylenolpyruvoylglucosamine reductase n=1 Tax=Desulfotruncus arcticus DSM 17038 TaxID=1121424 RepID=A0A1I2QJY6_9FIRM|nr:UDP-N-acetylmuramate dehydrogenase [Desulfotruncus arcticus]SFG27933.1 UDP-N-acetylmuramate dehydrogenase [Desulfotomaculum arcticum] [Desulfotruncus arcticus DSM 17038]